MNIKLELIQNHITYIVKNALEEADFDASEIADTTAISALSEIKAVVSNENLCDFDAMENIVNIFEKYNIDFGGRHDF